MAGHAIYRNIVWPLLLLHGPPALRPASVLSGRSRQLDDFRHVEAHFTLNDFKQGNVRNSEIINIGNQRSAHRAAAIQLTDPA